MTPATLYIVDDDAIFLESLVDFLELFDEYVIVGSALTGKKALADLTEREELPALIISDVMMPDVDGFALAAALAERWGEPIRVLLLTAGDMRVMQRRMPAPGVVALESKLTIIDDLIPLLDSLL